MAVDHRKAKRLGVQALAAALLIAAAAYLVFNTLANLEARRIASGFAFLWREAGFEVGETTFLAYSAADTYARALLVGLANTFQVAILGIVAATLIGTGIGLLSLSPNALPRNLAASYVEFIRNVPLLVQLFFWYALITEGLPPAREALSPLPGVFLTNRGLFFPSFTGAPELQGFNFAGGAALSPEFAALLIGLSLYTAAFIAEIVRAGVMAVRRDQWHAAQALGLERRHVLRYVVAPHALRVIVPPLTSQYLNLTKNSSLAVAIGYPDLVSIANTTINQTGQAIEGIAIIMAVYLTISLAISALMNWWECAAAMKKVFNLLLLLAILYLGWKFVDWAFVRAVWQPDASACRAASGACWGFIVEKHRLIAFGTYPYEEHWRPALSSIFLVALWVLSAVRHFWKPRLILIWTAGLTAIGVLMWGGVFGLPYVENERWGGLILTLLLTTFGLAFAFPLSILLALGRRSELPLIRALCVAYIELIRGVPLISVLFMASVMLPLFLPAGVSVDKLLRAQIALILFAAAYLAEVVRGGLQAIPKHQYEAADALGFGYFQKTFLIVLPQALRVVVPPLVNTCIGFFKDTSLVLIIGLFDLLSTIKVSLNDPAWTGFGVEAYLFAALVYFVCCFAMSRYSRSLEKPA